MTNPLSREYDLEPWEVEQQARDHAAGRDCGHACDLCGASARAWLEREAAKASPESMQQAESFLLTLFAGAAGGAADAPPCPTIDRGRRCMLREGHKITHVLGPAGGRR